ncbi:unnamed protein product [Rhodiola kirilowii]
MNTSSHLISSSSTFLFILLFLGSSHIHQAQEFEDEREFDYIEGSKKGPGHWGDLRKEWSDCKNGDLQSPIDLSSQRVKIIHNIGKLHRKYWARKAIIKNRGHDIAIEWEGDAGWIKINGSGYKLQQSHWHSPSEHTVNGRRYAMELHMVHKSNDPKAIHKLAVVGMLYQIGQPDHFISELMKNITLTSDSETTGSGLSEDVKGIKVVDPNEIKLAGQNYYRYIGSLTVPPCTEGVIWTMNKKVRTVSRAQLAFLREAVHDHAESNARPVQALNRRGIYYYTPRIRSN